MLPNHIQIIKDSITQSHKNTLTHETIILIQKKTQQQQQQPKPTIFIYIISSSLTSS